MNRYVAMCVMAATVVVVAGCGSGGAGGDGPVTDAICADVADGATPMNLYASGVGGDRAGDDFEAFLLRHMERGCPDAATAEPFASYFAG